MARFRLVGKGKYSQRKEKKESVRIADPEFFINKNLI